MKIIVAVSNPNYGIGIDGQLPPWNLSKDMQHFKKCTTSGKSNAVIMGQKTFESIPEKYRPLSNRLNIVLSLTKEFSGDNVVVYKSFQEAIDKTLVYDNVFVIGGESLYKEAIEHVDTILLTSINKDYPDCDRFFPDPLKYNFEIHSKSLQMIENGISFEFQQFIKRKILSDI